MELVCGIRITDYCDQEQLRTRDRLDLFIKVCQAIQHAHQKGIIHRDIKPSNILVTLHDGVPVPKVIDFGIAKAVEGRLTDATVYTQLHQFIGTPAYMSPEQAEMSGLDIDTRSDIYSLGVLLYELLTGSTPFDAKELMSQGIDAMRRTIREKEPVRPSTRLTQLRQQEQSQSSIAKGQGRAAKAKTKSEIRNHKSEIETDLDWIVMKCLEKDRGRRYETANGLAADLKRHLGNEPVVARPPTTVYRLQRAFRRNRLAFSAGATVIVSLCVAVISLAFAIEGNKQALEAAQRSAAELARVAILSGAQDETGKALADAERSRLPEGKLRYLRGMHLVASAQHARAIPELEAVRRLEPDNVAALGLLATARMAASGWRAYEPLIPELERARPVTSDDKLWLGQAWAMKDAARGLPLLDEVIQADGSPRARIIRAAARTWQAVQRMDLQLMQEALDDIAAAEAWRPHSISVLIEACTAHRVAAELHRRAGHVAEAVGLARRSEAASERLESFHPNLQALRARLDHLILTGDFDGAIQRARRWAGEVPGRNLDLTLVYPLMRQGHFEAVFQLTRAPQTDELMQLAHFLAAIELPEHRAEATHMASQVAPNIPENLNVLFVAVTMNLLTDRGERAQNLARDYLRTAGWLDRSLGASMRRVVRYLAGELSEEALLKEATTAFASATAHHFVGLRLLEQRDREAARRHLATSSEAGEGGGTGGHISAYLLERLDQNADWPPTLPKRTGSPRP